MVLEWLENVKFSIGSVLWKKFSGLILVIVSRIVCMLNMIVSLIYEVMMNFLRFRILVVFEVVVILVISVMMLKGVSIMISCISWLI